MPEFSDLLRKRLASRGGVGDHPDADTLTAYTERLLSSPVRDQVMEHLSLCYECREVASLSLCEIPIATDARKSAIVPDRKPIRRGWAPWFGLAASCAAMAIVAALIVKFPHQQRVFPSHVQEQAKAAAPAPVPAAVAPSPSATPAATAETVAPARTTRPAEPTARRNAQERHVVTAASAVVLGGSAPQPPPPVIETSRTTASNLGAIAGSIARRDYVNEKLFAQPEADRNVPTVGELPNTTVLGQIASDRNSAELSMFPELAQPTIGGVPPKPLAAAPAGGRAGFTTFAAKVAHEAKQIVRRRSLAVDRNVMTFSAMGGTGQFNPANEKSQTVEAEAAPSSAQPGGDLDQTQAFTRRALSPGAKAAVDTRFQPSWDVGDGKLLKTNESGAWISGYTGSDIQFSAVSFHGPEVWAGGNHAALLHSRDSGATWERVHLGNNATGSISSISANGQSIQITTSENQSWSSDDGGKTWIQQ